MVIEDIRALGDDVIVEYKDRWESAQERTSFLLAKPPLQGVPNRGVVRAVGSGITDISVGDIVRFNEPNPDAFRLEGVGYFRLRHDQVLAIEED